MLKKERCFGGLFPLTDCSLCLAGCTWPSPFDILSTHNWQDEYNLWNLLKSLREPKDWEPHTQYAHASVLLFPIRRNLNPMIYTKSYFDSVKLRLRQSCEKVWLRSKPQHFKISRYLGVWCFQELTEVPPNFNRNISQMFKYTWMGVNDITGFLWLVLFCWSPALLFKIIVNDLNVSTFCFILFCDIFWI